MTKTTRQDDEIEDAPDAGATQPEPAPASEPAPKPAEIKAAQYDYDGTSILLTIRPLGSDFDAPFMLNATDQNGLSPWFREELARMVAAGEIVVQPAPIYEYETLPV